MEENRQASPRPIQEKAKSWCTWFLYICIWLIWIPTSILFLFAPNAPDDTSKGENNISDLNNRSDYLISTAGCKISNLTIMDGEIKRFIRKPNISKCSEKPPLVGSDKASIFIINSSLASYNITNLSLLSCCYQSITRKEPMGKKIYLYFEFSDKCINFKEKINIFEEYIKVSCMYQNKTNYEDFFSFIAIKNRTTSKQELNIFMLGISGLSRLNFHRQMPKTSKFLLKELSAVELLGYNKIGKDRFSNVITLLTGLSTTDIFGNCWLDRKYFDNCHFIWDEYKENGFFTAFNENAYDLGTFNFRKMGFKNQPTDYMWGFFDRVMEDHIGNFANIRCVGSRKLYKVFLHYITNFITVMQENKSPYFAFNWESSISPENINFANVYDKAYSTFFRKLSKLGHLNNTIVVFLSDYGLSAEVIRKCYRGVLEEKLPFCFLIIPDWFRWRFSNAFTNLMDNRGRLITMYDLHETLKELINPEVTLKNLQDASSCSCKKCSLFKKISTKRTCQDIGVDRQFCGCIEKTKSNPNKFEFLDYLFY